MNPLSIHARNYRCFEQLDFELPDGCLAILGANGAGKSSIVNAIDLTIFGPESRSLADALSDQADDELLLELELEHAGARYRIRRTFSARGRGKTTLDFEHFLDDEHTTDSALDWEPLTRSSTKETQELIEQMLGLSRETFRASAFLAQGDGAAFTEAQPRDRKRILAQVLGLDRYDRLQARATDERKTMQGQHQELTGRIRACEETVAERPTVEIELGAMLAAIVYSKDAVADLEREHADLTERYQASREQAARRQAAEVQARAARAELERLMAADARATDAVEQITLAQAELAKIPAGDTAELQLVEAELVTAVQEHQQLQVKRAAVSLDAERLTRERDDLRARIRDREQAADALLAQIAALESGTLEHCPTCAQALGADARAATIDTLTRQSVAAINEAHALAGQIEAIQIPQIPPEPASPPIADLEKVRAELRDHREGAAQRARLEERVTQLQTTVNDRPASATLKAAHAALTSADSDLEALEAVDLDEITRQGQAVKQRLDSARVTLEQQTTHRARLQERLARITETSEQLDKAVRERSRLEEQMHVILQLERAFGRDGIPALIVENTAIPYLETEANRILAELGTSFRVELRTQAELKSGDGLRDTLDVVVSTDVGERAYETFSGGERTRINLALRIALARLLAHRRGAESRLLAIDEPEFLDEQGTAALVDVLNGLRSDFDKLYIVSHVPALRDSFDTTLTVTRDGDWSRVDTGLEAVPA